ncbi:MAG: hypothetical protein ACREHG_10215 [Candidatus Saccharimonadales bacterium]
MHKPQTDIGYVGSVIMSLCALAALVYMAVNKVVSDGEVTSLFMATIGAHAAVSASHKSPPENAIEKTTHHVIELNDEDKN